MTWLNDTHGLEPARDHPVEAAIADYATEHREISSYRVLMGGRCHRPPIKAVYCHPHSRGRLTALDTTTSAGGRRGDVRRIVLGNRSRTSLPQRPMARLSLTETRRDDAAEGGLGALLPACVSLGQRPCEGVGMLDDGAIAVVGTARESPSPLRNRHATHRARSGWGGLPYHRWKRSDRGPVVWTLRTDASSVESLTSPQRKG